MNVFHFAGQCAVSKAGSREADGEWQWQQQETKEHFLVFQIQNSPLKSHPASKLWPFLLVSALDSLLLFSSPKTLNPKPFTQEPRAVTMELGEPIRKCPKGRP
jgi:hypothetical protein